MSYRVSAKALLLLALGVLPPARSEEEGPPSAEATPPAKALTDRDMPALARVVSALWREKPLPEKLPPRLEEPARAVYLSTRAKTRRRETLWRTAGTVLDALRSALDEARRSAGDAAAEVDTIEIVLAHSFVKRDPVAEHRKLAANIHRGVQGLELRFGDRVERYSPTYAISSNRGNARLLERFQEKHGLTDRRMREEVEHRTFEAEQLLVRLTDPPGAVLMERGNRLVRVEDVDLAKVRGFARLAIAWLAANVHPDGRMTYLYWPSAVGEAAGRNNMIRQWMATNALIQAAAHDKDRGEELESLAARNIDYNLSRYYRDEADLGVIEYAGKVKLGSVALAALALHDHPQRERWLREARALDRMVDHLWNPDGSFRTFYRPAGRDDNQNFYPGEALLLWASRYQREKDERLYYRFDTSFRYYREWHLDPRNRNPAFVPWHTQACYLFWKETRDAELEEFIFTMNDWLIENLQEREGDGIYRDTIGRFYHPSDRYGPPHASSTGVYLEGLADAFVLARTVGDAARRERYRRAIVLGLRSALQLQFADDVDMFYVAEEERPYVHGGVRTTVYDNQIRCDNVQHNLRAVLKILAAFRAEDFTLR